MRHCHYILGIFFLIYSLTALADEVVNVYNWSGYISNKIIKQFERETNIHVNYSTYDSNETLYAKLKANPHSGYDIIVPSTYFLDRMRKQGMLQPLDKSKLSNFKNINPQFLNKNYDPNNNYSIPYLWGTTAAVINSHYYPKQSFNRWSDLWSPQYHDKLLLLDDTREVFSMALISLGFSANDTNPEHIKMAYLKLKALLPNIRLFNGEAEQAIYIDEDATIGMGWSGDIYWANQENNDVQYIYPQEGFVIWLDSMAIPKNAPHIDNAYKLIDFLLRPDIAKEISVSLGYATPNQAALKLLPIELQTNPIVYPDKVILKRGQFQTDVGEANTLYEKYWELLKIGA